MSDFIYINGQSEYALTAGSGLISDGGVYDGAAERTFSVDFSRVLSKEVGNNTISGNLNLINNLNVGNAQAVLTTGTQLISGAKTFAQRVFVNGTGVLLSGDPGVSTTTSNSLTFGFGLSPSGSTFNGSLARTLSVDTSQVLVSSGSQTISGQKTFLVNPFVGLSNPVLTTGDQIISGNKTFSGIINQGAGFDINIGNDSNINYFGFSVNTGNYFGLSGNYNDFGGASILNSFGSGSPINEFGKNSTNRFGESGTNIWHSGVFTGQTIFQNNIVIGNGRPVMNTGQEIISGIKTFANDLIVSGDIVFGTDNYIIGNQVPILIGGSGNYCSGNISTIVGGTDNNISGDISFIGCGFNNDIIGNNSLIINGSQNIVNNNFNSIDNGNSNQIVGGILSAIQNGSGNIISGSNSFIGVGINNRIIVSNLESESFSFIAGGSDNSITSQDSMHSYIGVGSGNTISGSNSFIGNGSNNTISGSLNSILVGTSNNISGYSNCIYGTSNIINGNYSSVINSTFSKINADDSFIGGGDYNEIYKNYSFIGCGSGNKSSGDYCFIGDGSNNEIKSNSSAIVVGDLNLILEESSNNFIGAGINNKISGNYSSILNGSNNEIYANYSTVIGRRCIIPNGQNGSVVISDGLERNH